MSRFTGGDGFKKKSASLVLALVLILAVWLLLNRFSVEHGLTGLTYDNEAWNGEPVWTQLDQKILFEKSEMSRRAGFSSQLSVIWQGFIYIPKDSRYIFSITSDDGSWVYIDQSPIINNGGRHPAKREEAEVALSQGAHAIIIRYFDAGGSGMIDFTWHENARRPRIFPGFFLYPKPPSARVYRFDQVLPTIRFLVKLALLAWGIALVVMVQSRSSGQNPVLRFSIVLFLILFLAYESQVFMNRSTAVTGCDTYAYLQGAALMAQKGLFQTEFEDPLAGEIYRAFAKKPSDNQLMFLLSPHGHYIYRLGTGLTYNVFPPGFSLLLLPFVEWLGIRSAFYVLPVLSLLCLGLLFYLTSRYVNTFFGICACSLAFFNAPVFDNTTSLMGDVPSMILVSLSVFFLFKGFRRERKIWSFAAGAAFGLSLVFRYSNIAIGIPLLFLFAVEWKRNRNPRAAAGYFFSFVGAVLVFGLVPLGVYTHHLFGTVFRLVYDPGTQSQMRLANLVPGAAFYLKSLYRTFTPLGIFVIGLGLADRLGQRKTRSFGLLCLLGFSSFFLFYSVQSIRHDRYLVPAYVGLALLYGFGALALIRKFERPRILNILMAVFLASFPLLSQPYNAGIIHEETTARAIQKKAEPRAVFFCDDMTGPLRFYAGFPAYRFVWTSPPVLRETMAILQTMNRPIYFLLDSEAAKAHYQYLINLNALDPNKFALIAVFNGQPLYRYQDQ